MRETEDRCPSCGALVAADAEWCGQCLRPLREEPAPSRELSRLRRVLTGNGQGTASAGSPAPLRAPEGPTWTCPACEHVNAIELDRCEVCGTPFARLFAEPEPAVEIAPSRALAWSLLLPGLGHWKAGRRLDGVARSVLFAWTLGTVIVLLSTRSGGQGFGRVAPLFLVFLAAALGLYVVSATDAYRIAGGQVPVVSSRVLLWAAVVLVVASVLLATMLALSAARGR